MRGLGLGLSLTRRGSSAFDPASLFTGAGGAWYEIAPAYVYQTTDTSTPGVVGQPVGRVTDRSGNGFHLTQGTAASRPVLRQSGSLYYLEFDGTNDFLSVASFTYVDASGFNGQAVGVSFDTIAAGTPCVFQCDNGAGKRQDLRRNAGVLESVVLDTTPTAFVDSAASVTATEVCVLSATLGTGKLVECRKNGATNGTTAVSGTLNTGTNSFFLGCRNSAADFLDGNFYGGIWLGREPTTTERANMESWCASKCGVTL